MDYIFYIIIFAAVCVSVLLLVKQRARKRRAKRINQIELSAAKQNATDTANPTNEHTEYEDDFMCLLTTQGRSIATSGNVTVIATRVKK